MAVLDKNRSVGRLSTAFHSQDVRRLKYHPRKEQVIDKVLAPMIEAADAVQL